MNQGILKSLMMMMSGFKLYRCCCFFRNGQNSHDLHLKKHCFAIFAIYVALTIPYLLIHLETGSYGAFNGVSYVDLFD